MLPRLAPCHTNYRSLDFLLLRLLVLVFRRALRISALYGALLRFRHRKPSLEKRRSRGRPARSGRHLRKALAPGPALRLPRGERLMTRHLFAAPFAGFTILSPKRPYVPTMVQVRKPSVWHASPLNKTLTAAPYDEIKKPSSCSCSTTTTTRGLNRLAAYLRGGMPGPAYRGKHR